MRTALKFILIVQLILPVTVGFSQFQNIGIIASKNLNPIRISKGNPSIINTICLNKELPPPVFHEYNSIESGEGLKIKFDDNKPILLKQAIEQNFIQLIAQNELVLEVNLMEAAPFSKAEIVIEKSAVLTDNDKGEGQIVSDNMDQIYSNLLPFVKQHLAGHPLLWKREQDLYWEIDALLEMRLLTVGKELHMGWDLDRYFNHFNVSTSARFIGDYPTTVLRKFKILKELKIYEKPNFRLQEFDLALEKYALLFPGQDIYTLSEEVVQLRNLGYCSSQKLNNFKVNIAKTRYSKEFPRAPIQQTILQYLLLQRTGQYDSGSRFIANKYKDLLTSIETKYPLDAPLYILMDMTFLMDYYSVEDFSNSLITDLIAKFHSEHPDKNIEELSLQYFILTEGKVKSSEILDIQNLQHVFENDKMFSIEYFLVNEERKKYQAFKAHEQDKKKRFYIQDSMDEQLFLVNEPNNVLVRRWNKLEGTYSAGSLDHKTIDIIEDQQFRSVAVKNELLTRDNAVYCSLGSIDFDNNRVNLSLNGNTSTINLNSSDKYNELIDSLSLRFKNLPFGTTVVFERDLFQLEFERIDKLGDGRFGDKFLDTKVKVNRKWLNCTELLRNVNERNLDLHMILSSGKESDLAKIRSRTFLKSGMDIVAFYAPKSFEIQYDIVKSMEVLLKKEKMTVIPVELERQSSLLPEQITQSKAIILSGHKNDNFEKYLKYLADNGFLKGKTVAIFSCNENATTRLNSYLIKKGEASRILFFPSKIHQGAVKLVLDYIAKISNSRVVRKNGIEFEELIKKAIDRSLLDVIEELKKVPNDQYYMIIKKELEYLMTIIPQISLNFNKNLNSNYG